MSFAKKYGDKYGKKLVDAATKTGIDAAKTASTKTKTAEVTGGLIGNIIADKINSVSKKKVKKRKKFTYYQKKDSKL